MGLAVGQWRLASQSKPPGLLLRGDATGSGGR
jgi:hypothetical protein